MDKREEKLNDVAEKSADKIYKLIPDRCQGVGVGSPFTGTPVPTEGGTPGLLPVVPDLRLIVYLKKALRADQKTLVLGYLKEHDLSEDEVYFNVIGEVTAGG